ncbi:uncharacterized protein LOC125758899 [Rhipicephalus sanguineus]|uniref:uncharacterized protein LOC125758899 n=1 Tax=Rhipicephalus sanguineus TaxID=34632 RepID=UPI0020C4956D|nr:uncharacterized protein LOC125758899 [Rhipicephalus sanguineus]
MRKEKRAVYYLDETWVNAGHTKEKVWEDAFRKGLITGLRAPSGKGGLLIVIHAGSENGFVDGASFVFRAKKSVTSDYHSEMDGPRFERWFKEQLLPNIEPRSSNDQLKPELIQLVNQNKHRSSGYRIALAKVAGHDIVRLPPYHCEFNPIERVWSQVKGYIAANRSFTLAGVEELLDEAIALVSPENWACDCAHVVRLEEEAWEQDVAIESTLDGILITLGSDSCSCSDSSVSELSGMRNSGEPGVRWLM